MPCWIIELMSSIKRGVDVFIVLVAHLPRPVERKRNLNRLQRRAYRRHTRFKSKRTSCNKWHRFKKVRKSKDDCDGWASLGAPLPHWVDLLSCFLIPPRVNTRAEAFDVLWEEVRREQLTNSFLAHQDPTTIMKIANLSFLPSDTTSKVSTSFKHLFLNSIDSPMCFLSMAVLSSVIVDSGTSVCISPHCSDFVTYNNSNMKIKDLSSSNTVAGEGIVRWNLEDSLGNPVEIEVLGYHIPTAEVCLRPKFVFSALKSCLKPLVDRRYSMDLKSSSIWIMGMNFQQDSALAVTSRSFPWRNNSKRISGTKLLGTPQAT